MLSIDEIIKRGLEQQSFIDEWFDDNTLEQKVDDTEIELQRIQALEKEKRKSNILPNEQTKPSALNITDLKVSWIPESYSSGDEKSESGFGDGTINDIFDFTLKPELRIESLRLFCIEYHKDIDYNDKILEIVSKIINLYTLSSITSIRSFIMWMCTYEYIPVTLRVESALAIRDFGGERQRKLGNDLLYSIDISKEPTVIQMKHYCGLLNESDDYKDVLNAIVHIILDNRIKCEDRYKLLVTMGLENIDYTTYIGFEFLFTNKSNPPRMNELEDERFQIMFASYLHPKCNDEEKMLVEDYLLNTASNTNLSEDTRADALDSLLHIGSSVVIEKATALLMNMGGGRTIYENTQNIHLSSIEKSIVEIVTTVSNMLFCQRIDPPSFEAACDDLKENYSDIDVALRRIDIDRVVFKSVNKTLKSVFLLIYTYIQIQSDELKQQMTQRLVEELREMTTTCSTGYLGRLVNTLSGFGDFRLGISWEDQIISTFATRFNQLIIASEHVDEILDEMTEGFDRQAHIRELHQKTLAKLRQEMYEEYHDYMEDVEFDTYFGIAYQRYNMV